jgi:uncharacterized protein
VLTGGQAGVYYPLGVALGQIYGKALPDTKTSVQATKASVENLNLLQAGRGEIALHSRRFAVRRLEGRGRRRLQGAADQAAHHCRHLSQLHPDRRQRRRRHQDGCRPQGQAHLGRRTALRHRTERARRAQGRRLEYKDFSKVEYLPFGESVELMKNRQLDVTLQSAGLGVASIRDLCHGGEDRRRADSGRCRGQGR